MSEKLAWWEKAPLALARGISISTAWRKVGAGEISLNGKGE